MASLWLISVAGFMLSFASLLLLCGCIYLLYIHSRYSHLPGPPRSSFFLGNSSDLKAYIKDGKTFYHYVLDMYEQHGSIFVFFIAHKPIVMLADPLYIKQVFVDLNTFVPKDDSLYSKAGFVYGQRALGYGLVTNTDTSSWLRRRQIIGQAFHRENLKHFMAPFNKVTDKLLTRLTSCALKGSEVRMLQELGNTTLHTIAQVAFSIDLGSIGEENSIFREAIIRMLEGIEDNIRSPLPSWVLNLLRYSFLQSDTKRSQINGTKLSRDFARKCISERISEIKTKSVNAPNDLITSIVKCAEKDATVTMEDLVDEFITIFFAGHETTASSLAFTLFEVISNPDIEQKILDEVEDVIGTKDRVDYDDLPQLKFTEQCIMEGLRKFMIAGGPTRLLTRDIVVGGFKVPAGCRISANKYAMCRSSSFWENPDVFNPSRFSENISNYRYVYFPFSLGPRNCVGRKFAIFEEKVILARLIQKFKFRLSHGQTSTMEKKVTVTVKDGVRCTVELR